MFARPLILFYKIMYPFIWLLNGSARLLTGLFGLKPASENELAHSEEELRIFLSESFKSGEINQSEFKYVNKIFEFDDRVAKEIMVPRTEIVSIDQKTRSNDIFEIVQEEQYTRYPVIDGDKDNIIGIVNMKEILIDIVINNSKEKINLKQYMRPVIEVIETIPIHDLLLKMQRERMHMAILIDEYGGTAGIVTVEDILEEIVGEIRDEFDADELPLIQKVKPDHYIVDGKLLVSELNELLGTTIDDTDVDTIGGWVLTEKYDVKQGESLSFDQYDFTVTKMEGHHIQYIDVIKKRQVHQSTDEAVNVSDMNQSQALSS